MAHSNWECRYCDSPFKPIHIGDELICRCGAEWEDAKILVTISDDEYYEMVRELNSSRYDRDEYEDDDDDYYSEENYLERAERQSMEEW